MVDEPSAKQYPTPVGQSSVPVPDPTILTTQASEKAVANLKELQESATKALKEVIEARLDGNDKAIELLQQTADRIPAMIGAEVERLQELHEEKFSSVATQFRERDTRTEQASKDSKIAIDAALQAQKESVAKTEGTFTKQIDQIGSLIAAGTKSTEGQISDLKDRITAIESAKKGSGETVGWIVAAIGTVATVLTIVGAVIAILSMKGP